MWGGPSSGRCTPWHMHTPSRLTRDTRRASLCRKLSLKRAKRCNGFCRRRGLLAPYAIVLAGSARRWSVFIHAHVHTCTPLEAFLVYFDSSEPAGPRQCSYFESTATCNGTQSSGLAGSTNGAQDTTCNWNSKDEVCMFSPSADIFLPSFEFRLIVGLGAIPAAIVMISALQEEDPPHSSKTAAAGGSVLAEILEHPEHWRTLIGTGGTWLLYDVSYYGTNIFLPVILSKIFGNGLSAFSQSLVVTCRHHCRAAGLYSCNHVPEEVWQPLAQHIWLLANGVHVCYDGHHLAACSGGAHIAFRRADATYVCTELWPEVSRLPHIPDASNSLKVPRIHVALS